MKFQNDEEIKIELDSVEFQNKLTAYSGRKYPIEYLNHREFEILIYFVYKKEIELGIHSDKYDTIRLMKGVAERGRDCILQFKGNNVAVIQCKRYTGLITKPDFARELIKFSLHYLQDKSLVSDINNFTYYFVALAGFNEKAQSFIDNFNKEIDSESKIKEWVEEVLEDNESIKFKSYDEVKIDLLNTLKKININPIIGVDIDQKLKNYKEIVAVFFEVEKVASQDMLDKMFQKYTGFKNDEDLEKLRLRLQDVPKENRMFFGLFSIYGYDLKFYKLLVKDRSLISQIAEIRSAVNQRFIAYLKETIDKFTLLFVSGLKDVSPFTKQVVTPYLFNKYALIYNKAETGEFFYDMLRKDKNDIITKFQTIEEHKHNLIEIGKKIIANDFSSFTGDGEFLDFKIDVAKWIHRGLTSVKEMSETFDKDMIKLKPIVEQIEEQIKLIVPTNPTIIIENSSLGKTKEEFLELMNGVKKFDS